MSETGAERTRGEILAEMVRAGERQKRESGRPKKESHAATLFPPPKLSDLGITKQEASRVQRLAAVLTHPPTVRKAAMRGLARAALGQ